MTVLDQVYSRFARAHYVRRPLRRPEHVEALRCDAGEWLAALDDLGQFFDGFGSRLPVQIASSLAETRGRFGAAH